MSTRLDEHHYSPTAALPSDTRLRTNDPMPLAATTSRLLALAVAILAAASACTDEADPGSSPGPAAVTSDAPGGQPDAAPAPTTAAPPALPPPAPAGDLAGLKGTVPLANLSNEFRQRLLDVDPTLTSFEFAGEAYDATIVLALAVERAQSDGTAMVSQIAGITRDGEKCHDFASCRSIIDAGGDPDYDGVSGPITLNGAGDPLEGTYGVLTIGADNRVDPGQTSYVIAGSDAEADLPAQAVERERDGDGVFVVGTLLPLTGGLAFLGLPQIAGVDVAEREVNAAGGVLGVPMQIARIDAGLTAHDARSALTALMDRNVDAVVGAATSEQTRAVIDEVTAGGVVLFSASNLTDELSGAADRGLYFRTSPPDRLEGRALAQLLSADGATSVAVIARRDAYGQSLTDVMTAALSDLAIDVAPVMYEVTDENFDDEVAQVALAAPNAVVIVGYAESSDIVRSLIDGGLGPGVIAMYGCGGNIGDLLGERYDAGE
jgi:ABC-type branched-subunit amino acid transport system substrate-binding protein